jgi:hypothetical protein
VTANYGWKSLCSVMFSLLQPNAELVALKLCSCCVLWSWQCTAVSVSTVTPARFYPRISRPKSSSFSLKIIYNATIYKRKYAIIIILSHNYLQRLEHNLINFFINLSYLTPISHQIFVNLFLFMWLSLPAQGGFEVHKTNVVTSSPPHSGQNIWIYTKRFSREDNTSVYT